MYTQDLATYTNTNKWLLWSAHELEFIWSYKQVLYLEFMQNIKF